MNTINMDEPKVYFVLRLSSRAVFYRTTLHPPERLLISSGHHYQFPSTFSHKMYSSIKSTPLQWLHWLCTKVGSIAQWFNYLSFFLSSVPSHSSFYSTLLIHPSTLITFLFHGTVFILPSPSIQIQYLRTPLSHPQTHPLPANHSPSLT